MPSASRGGSTDWQPGSVCSSRKHTRMLCPDVQAWHCLGTLNLRPENTVQSALPRQVRPAHYQQLCPACLQCSSMGAPMLRHYSWTRQPNSHSKPTHSQDATLLLVWPHAVALCST